MKEHRSYVRMKTGTFHLLIESACVLQRRRLWLFSNSVYEEIKKKKKKTKKDCKESEKMKCIRSFSLV